jgi:hypothetical protein
MLRHSIFNVQKLPINLTILNILKDMPRFYITRSLPWKVFIFLTQIGLNQRRLHKTNPMKCSRITMGCDPWCNTWNVQFTVICDAWPKSRSKWYSKFVWKPLGARPGVLEWGFIIFRIMGSDEIWNICGLVFHCNMSTTQGSLLRDVMVLFLQSHTRSSWQTLTAVRHFGRLGLWSLNYTIGHT